MDNLIEFNRVWKKFKRGERFNSLRDAIPNFFRKFISAHSGEEILGKREFWALKDVSFTVKKGEVLGIIGPNGAGKSTILKLLSRIMVPNKGEIEIRGRISALIEVTAGFHPELTGRENIYLNGTILGMTKKEIDKKFNAIVEFSGLKDFIDTPVKRYSSGMYSRLGFSVAAHMDPDILLVDEVLSVGDIAFQAKCAQKMRELLNSGVTIVLVSHNLSLIKSLCRRVILLAKGEVLKEGSPQEVIPYYQDIVYKEREKKLKEETIREDKVKINIKPPVEIERITLYDGEFEEKEDYDIDEPLCIEVEYYAKENIKNPVFSLDIVRNDGILCYSANTKEDGFKLESIYGKGRIKIDLGKINLNRGLYILKVSIWEENFINLYHKATTVLKIKGDKILNNAVMFKKFRWEEVRNNCD